MNTIFSCLIPNPMSSVFSYVIITPVDCSLPNELADLSQFRHSNDVHFGEGRCVPCCNRWYSVHLIHVPAIIVDEHRDSKMQLTHVSNKRYLRIFAQLALRTFQAKYGSCIIAAKRHSLPKSSSIQTPYGRDVRVCVLLWHEFLTFCLRNR